MAYTPYLRYGTTSLALSGITAPTFPVQRGERMHTYPTDKAEYTTTARRHATTQTGWQTEGVQKTTRDAIRDFWATTLSRGYYDVTAIDNRARMLFDASWNDWQESWRKDRGGIYQIGYGLQSPVPWTPPCFGAFLTTTNDLVSHTLTGDDLDLDTGILVNYAADNAILRKNGYALKVAGTAGGDIGAYGTVSWKSASGYNSTTLFCQFRAGAVADVFSVIQLSDSGINSNSLSIQLGPVDASNNALIGVIYNGGSSAEVTLASGAHPALAVDTWYDVAITYNAVNAVVNVHWYPSAITSFADFADGADEVADWTMSTMSSAIYPPDITWKVLSLLREYSIGGITAGNFYLQNAMVFDGFITPLEFNTLRRLCFMWNNKTTGTWPA